MALNGIYCSSCGLEILSDQKVKYVPGTNDAYHDVPYNCYVWKDMGVY